MNEPTRVICRLRWFLHELGACGLTSDINELTEEISKLVATMAPALLAIPGCGALTAAKILSETIGPAAPVAGNSTRHYTASR